MQEDLGWGEGWSLNYVCLNLISSIPDPGDQVSYSGPSTSEDTFLALFQLGPCLLE